MKAFDIGKIETEITHETSTSNTPRVRICFCNNALFCHDWRSAPAFDVKHLLHPGENIVIVAVANWDRAGGINKGAILRMQGKTILPEWKRSVFNGLVQIIAQSTKAPGEIKLTARAEDLSPAIVTIQSQPGTSRPCVP